MLLARAIGLLIVALLLPAPRASAQALIPFDEAVATTEKFVPGIKVTKVEYALDPLTLQTIVRVFGPTLKLDLGWTMELDAATGEPITLFTDPLTDFQRATFLVLLSRQPLCNLSYSEAAELAASGLGQPLHQVRSVTMTTQHTLLVLQSRLVDLSVFNADAIARVRLADGFEGEPFARATSAQLSLAIATAEAELGPGWQFMRAWVVAQVPSIVVDACMLETKSGLLRRVRVTLGTVNTAVVSNPFTPRGSLSTDVQMRRSLGAAVVATPHQALSRMNTSATNVRFWDFRFSAVAGAPKWTGSCDSPNVFLSAEFTMFLDALEEASTAFIYGRRELSLLASDLDRDGYIAGPDLAEVLNAWGAFFPPYDLDGSGLVDGGDLAVLLNGWR
ncbi:MAG: hypothetical protein RL136_1030 [Planctomycetota bacterium]|jgi:hypothetical protein